MQGLGWVALEELKWGDPAHKWIRPGFLYTCGPGSYKIPSINDVPLKFNVSLLKVNILPISYQYLMGVEQPLQQYSIMLYIAFVFVKRKHRNGHRNAC